jgi:hypothetical protein
VVRDAYHWNIRVLMCWRECNIRWIRHHLLKHILFFKRASIILLLVAANASASCRRAVAHVRAVGRWLLCYQSEWEGNMSNQMGVAATRELYSTGRRRLPNHLESLFYTACIFEIKSGWDNWSRIMRESMPHESCA